MLLNLEALNYLRPKNTGMKTDYSEVFAPKPISKTTTEKVVTALSENGVMRVCELIKETELSHAAVYRTIKVLKLAGAVTKVSSRNSAYVLSDHISLEDELKKGRNSLYIGRRLQSNNKLGITGVSFNAVSKRFITSFGSEKTCGFDNLLDAACLRISLENKFQESA